MKESRFDCGTWHLVQFRRSVGYRASDRLTGPGLEGEPP